MRTDSPGTTGQGLYGSNAFDGTFGADPQLRADHGYLSEHKLADLMKKLLEVFYGKAPAYAFYDGCSQGGHEGLLEASSILTILNGVVSGAGLDPPAAPRLVPLRRPRDDHGDLMHPGWQVKGRN